MGIAVGILSILMALVMGALNSLGFIGAAFANDVKFAIVTLVGGGLSLLYLVGGAFAFGKPKIARHIFIIAAVIALITAINNAPAMWVWTIASIIFAVMSHYGFKEKEFNKKEAIPSSQPIHSGTSHIFECKILS